MSNSKLVNYTKWSPHCTKPRNSKIKGISIHTMAADGSVEGCGNVFQTRKASSHYGIGSDGRIGQYVDEANRAWCCEHSVDHSVVTIEVASLDTYKEPYRCSAKAYESLINLCVDICKRNGIKQLLWKEGKENCPAYTGLWDLCNLVPHRYTTSKGKSCPGNYLFSRYGDIANEVNKRLDGNVTQKEDELDMTKVEFLNSLTNEEAYNLLLKANAYVAAKETPAWAQDVWSRASESGLVDGTRPESYLKRDEFVTVLDRLGFVK